jgi:hypothetical protein
MKTTTAKSNIDGKLTYKKFVKWLNEEFQRLEIHDYEAIKAERTRFRTDDYEGGACKTMVWIRNKNYPVDQYFNNKHFMCFYFISEYQSHIDAGYEMYLKFDNGRMVMTDLTVELRKI